MGQKLEIASGFLGFLRATSQSLNWVQLANQFSDLRCDDDRPRTWQFPIRKLKALWRSFWISSLASRARSEPSSHSML